MTVSVIITCYNYAHYLPHAVLSCIDQNFNRSDYEIIVVQDGGSDDAEQVLEPFCEHVRIIHLLENVGVSAARNHGVREAKGKYVVFVDADDSIHRDLLLLQNKHLEENPHAAAVSVDYLLMHEDGSHLQHLSATEKPIACGIMFRKDLLMEVGLYDETFRAREEEDLRKRFLKQYRIHNISLPLYRYRRHTHNLTNNQIIMDAYLEKLCQKHR